MPLEPGDLTNFDDALAYITKRAYNDLLSTCNYFAYGCKYHVQNFFMRFFVSKSIYVGNLPWSATEDQVRNLFSQYGTVNSVNLVSDRETGRARGFGFVEMAAADAAGAIQALNGSNMDGRSLKVNEAQPKAPRQPRY